MFVLRWQLCRILGIPIRVDASWLFILALLSWSFQRFFQDEAPDLSMGVYWALGLGASLAFFACILLHELGHAVVARATGIPVRGITLFLFGGVAEMEDEPPSARSEFLMAIAGPAVSAGLVGLFWFLAGLTEGPALVSLLKQLAVVNLLLLLFNLVPAFPLDGGRVFRSVLWAVMGDLHRATWWASLTGQAFSMLLIGLGLLSIFSGAVFQGLWLCLVGMFLNNAAKEGFQQVVVRQLLRAEPVSRFMSHHPIVVSPSLDLDSWVEDFVFRYHRKLFPVSSNGHLEGVIVTRDLSQYPRKEWGKHKVAEVMRTDLEEWSIPLEADAFEALKRMQVTGSSRLLVTEKGQLVGIVALKDLLRYLNLKLEIERQ
jgi:Zn-dependent protease